MSRQSYRKTGGTRLRAGRVVGMRQVAREAALVRVLTRCCVVRASSCGGHLAFFRGRGALEDGGRQARSVGGGDAHRRHGARDAPAAVRGSGAASGFCLGSLARGVPNSSVFGRQRLAPVGAPGAACCSVAGLLWREAVRQHAGSCVSWRCVARERGAPQARRARRRAQAAAACRQRRRQRARRRSTRALQRARKAAARRACGASSPPKPRRRPAGRTAERLAALARPKRRCAERGARRCPSC